MRRVCRAYLPNKQPSDSLGAIWRSYSKPNSCSKTRSTACRGEDQSESRNASLDAQMQKCLLLRVRRHWSKRVYAATIVDKQFSYLSAVFCYIANNPAILRKIMLTESNDMAFYLTRLFPNGQPMTVAVDEIVPCEGQLLLHSKALEFELWMFVLEKAWTKLLGGYERSYGLSPEDAFE